MIKDVTINELAKMIKKGFDHNDFCFDNINKQFGQVAKRFDEAGKRFDKIEKLLIVDHQRRIVKLETDLKDLKELLLIR